MQRPDVSVVVIVFNDAERLPAAVTSVLEQTLAGLEVIICDDASTDGTQAVAEACVAADPRVRYVRLPVNSGGCSAPRNAGIQAARGDWVMFLDSDDTYERHACKNLLVAAEAADADVASGRVERVHVDEGGRRRQWFPHLYATARVLTDVREDPELLFDAVSVNKIYRRAFLDEHQIRFPEGVLYEDQLFTAQVYCSFARLAIIPELVYRWNVHGKGTSISNRRHELQNFVSRITVHRLIDDYLHSSGNGDLKPAKDLKFLKHDLRLYLNDLIFVGEDEGYLDEFFRLASDYLATVAQEAVALCSHVEQLVYLFVRLRDVEATQHVMDFLGRDGKISVALVPDGERVLWPHRQPVTGQDADLLDVTDLRLHKVPFAQAHLYNEVSRCRLVGDRLELAGSIVNQLGRIREDDALQVTLLVRRLQRRKVLAVPLTSLVWGPERITWTASVPVADLPLTVARTQTISPALRTTWDGHVNETSVTVRPDVLREVEPVPVRPPLGLLLGRRLEPSMSKNGFLMLRLVNDSWAAPVVATVARDPRTRTALTRAKRARTSLQGTTVKKAVFAVCSRLPVQPDLVVFESMQGRQYSDSPRAVAEALAKADLGFRSVWAFNPTARPGSVPKGTRTVTRESLRYYALLARAGVWVDNQGFPRIARKRRETTYLQTWHGTPLKVMGHDEPAVKRMDEQGLRALAGMVSRWDHLVVPNEQFERTFVPAYRYTGPLLRVGYPRNDVLVNRNDADSVRALREKLDLPTDRKIVLYAPTFREGSRGLMKLALELGVAEPALADDWFLLIRPHYLNRLKIPPQFAHFARDVSGIDDISELYLAADVLVTDYSSSMFDYANLGRPMVFFTYDYEDYTRASRGTYLELRDIAPGPLVSTTEELVDVLVDLEVTAARHEPALAAFRARFCSYETGHAASDVVDAVFRPLAAARGTG